MKILKIYSKQILKSGRKKIEVKYDYQKFTLDDILKGKKIIVPPFQRNVVWNEKKRMEFIQTLRAGNPFGSILVYKNEENFVLNDEYLELISYLSKEKINFIENRSDEFKNRYQEFIKLRINSVMEEIKKYLKRI